MKLKLQEPDRWDKYLYITDEDKDDGLSIKIDYDDVDHETVLNDTKEIIRRVNSYTDNI